MIGDINVKASRIINMADSFYQSIPFECRNCPVNRIKGNCLEMFSYLIIYIFSRWMISVLQKRSEYLSSLMSYSESLVSTNSFEPSHHLRYIDIITCHIRYNGIIVE
jgi:hypothetical protein